MKNRTDNPRKYKLEFAFYQYILPGHINEIPQKISTDMPEGMYYHAIYHQYRGDLSKALDLYSQSLKGMNTKTFSRLVRINKAVRLLQNPGTSISSVCYSAGFYDLSHFIHEFQRRHRNYSFGLSA